MVDEEPICSKEKKSDETENVADEKAASTSMSTANEEEAKTPTQDNDERKNEENLKQIKEMVSAAKEKGYNPRFTSK